MSVVISALACRNCGASVCSEALRRVIEGNARLYSCSECGRVLLTGELPVAEANRVLNDERKRVETKKKKRGWLCFW